MRLLLKSTFALTLLFTTCIGLIRAQPYDDSDLRAFLTPPDGCPMPCFIGIRPGVTTADEAIALLQASERIAEMNVNLHPDSGEITSVRWTWSDALFENQTQVGGSINFEGGITELAILTTPHSLADVWFAWGKADQIMFTTAGGLEGSSGYLVYRIAYPNFGTYIDGGLTCPYYPTIWLSEITFYMGSMENSLFPADRIYSGHDPFLAYAIEMKHSVC
jgi:hypothetical protein